MQNILKNPVLNCVGDLGEVGEGELFGTGLRLDAGFFERFGEVLLGHVQDLFPAKRIDDGLAALVEGAPDYFEEEFFVFYLYRWRFQKVQAQEA